jgi:hypothetical protein
MDKAERRIYLRFRRTLKAWLSHPLTMLGSIVVVLAASGLPGWALAAVLDGSSDRVRKALLAPSLGLLLLYGISGTLLLLDVWSLTLMWLAVVALNAVAYRTVTSRHEAVAQRSHWQRLEAAMHGEVAEDAVETTLSKEAEIQLKFQQDRNVPLLVVGFAVALLALLSPALQAFPFGVDWIGFAMLTQQVVLEGELVLSGTNTGFWTYPPAFPSLAAWSAATLNMDAGVAVYRLGHWTLFAVLLGMMGALDRHGAGGQAMLAMGLGLGLFAKTFDSGYPSVASQLGMVVGVLTLFRPADQRQRYHTVGVGLALWCVALIHPTGAIYLALLLLSHVLHGVSLEDETQRAWARKVAYLASAFITIGFAVALIVIAPRLFEEAVFSEYGWQGGRPMLVYNAPLLAVACFAAFALRHTLEGRIATTWFALLWLLSLVHVVEGLQHVPVLSLLSYTLYSMALHAFHVPLAVLVALWWSPTTELTSSLDEGGMKWGAMPKVVAWSLTGVMVFGAVVAAAVAVQLAEHDELLAVSPGDLALREALTGIEGSVYTENMHWGYVWNRPSTMATTSIPTLGLVHLSESEQNAATRAVYSDNTSYFLEKGMLHALSSPLGTVQWTLAESPYWDSILSVDGATLWELRPNGDGKTPLLTGLDEADCKDCTARLDPWRDHKFRDPLNLGNDRPFLPEGTPTDLRLQPPTGYAKVCLMYEVIGQPSAIYVNATSGLERPFHALQSTAGYHQTCFELNATTALDTLSVSWKSEEPSRWVNPLGLSGRDTVLLDQTGIKFQWLEWRE